MKFFFLLLLGVTCSALAEDCRPFYVRWQRVRLNVKHVSSARLSLKACESACSLSEDPQVPGRALECSALNHHSDVNGYSHVCEVFQPHQLQNVDGYVEADDRYSFYWKFCLNSTRRCGGDYAFTYLSDRYMESAEVIKSLKKNTLEECLADCLEEKQFPCRSISFNRTDGGCHLSANNQLTKPASVRLNNNPNFRIDYYENNCYNLSETFQFEQVCHDDGIEVSVKSKFPYTGAMYGLYDYFTCRIEPKEQEHFKYKFPSPMISKNCSDSIRLKGDEMILQVVLSTDGVEPLYFITPDDLTYEAKCPIQKKNTLMQLKPKQTEQDKNKDMDASARALFSALAKENPLPPKIQKDTFPLPLTTPQAIPITVATTTTTAKPTTTTTASTTTRLSSTAKTSTTTRAPITTTKAPTTTTKAPTTTTTTTTTTAPPTTRTTAVPSTTKKPVSTTNTPSTTTTTMQVKGLEDEGEIQANQVLADAQMDGKVLEELKDGRVPEGKTEFRNNSGILEIQSATGNITESEKKVEIRQNQTEITVEISESTREIGPTTISSKMEQAISVANLLSQEVTVASLEPQQDTVAILPSETTITNKVLATELPTDMSQMESDTVAHLRELMTKEKLPSMSENGQNAENAFIDPIMKLFRSQQMMEELADLTKMEEELRKAVGASQLLTPTVTSQVVVPEAPEKAPEAVRRSLQPMDDEIVVTDPVNSELSATVAEMISLGRLKNQTTVERPVELNDTAMSPEAPVQPEASNGTLADKEVTSQSQSITVSVKEAKENLEVKSNQLLVRKEKAVPDIEDYEAEDLGEEPTFEKIITIGRNHENREHTPEAPITQKTQSAQNTQHVQSAKTAPSSRKLLVAPKVKNESGSIKAQMPQTTSDTTKVPSTQKKPVNSTFAKPEQTKDQLEKQMRAKVAGERLPIPRDETPDEAKTVQATKKATESKDLVDFGTVKKDFKEKKPVKVPFREPVIEKTVALKTKSSEKIKNSSSHKVEVPVALPVVPRATATPAVPLPNELKPAKEPMMDKLSLLFDKGISMQAIVEKDLVNLDELEEFMSGPEAETTVTPIEPSSSPTIVSLPEPHRRPRPPTQSSSRRTLRVKGKARIPLRRTNQGAANPESKVTVTNKQARRPVKRGPARIETKPARKQFPVARATVANRQKVGNHSKSPVLKPINPKTQNRQRKLRREPVSAQNLNKNQTQKPPSKEVLQLTDKFLKSVSAKSNQTAPEPVVTKPFHKTVTLTESSKIQNRSKPKIGDIRPTPPLTPEIQTSFKTSGTSKNVGTGAKRTKVPLAPPPKKPASGTKVVKKGAAPKITLTVPKTDPKSRGTNPVALKKKGPVYKSVQKPVIPKPIITVKVTPKKRLNKAAQEAQKTGRRQPFVARLPVDRDQLAHISPAGRFHKDAFRRESVERKVEEFRNKGAETRISQLDEASFKLNETETSEIDAPLRDIDGELMAKIQQIEQVIMRNETTMRKINRKTRHLEQSGTADRTPTTTAAKTTTTVQATTAQKQAKPPAPEKPTTNTSAGGDKKGASPPSEHREPKNPVSFDIYKDGRPVETVVVGSKISLSFTPQYPIPPEYMSVRGCQVEPIDPKYEWEKEPLPIIKDACPADLVGLVCPPRKTEFGVQISVESFRYQTTPQVQYSCLVRICPFAACPQVTCLSVDGCPSDTRRRRGLSLDQIREALEQDPNLARQFGISPSMLTTRPAHTLEQQLLALGGDHVVKRRLVVVNSEDQLRYYGNTGDLP